MYLSLEPEAVRFAYGPQGKPRLAHASADARLRFNVSHAHGLLLVAVACAREVGVDVEYVRPIPEADRIAERMFSLQERERLHRLPDSERLPAFFTAWTLKEAYVKGLGHGLLMNDAAPSRSGAWWSCAFSPRPGYQAALAVQGQECQWWLGTWTWGAQPRSLCVDQARA
jgi:4'-phosphopantetheinyl transferase